MIREALLVCSVPPAMRCETHARVGGDGGHPAFYLFPYLPKYVFRGGSPALLLLPVEGQDRTAEEDRAQQADHQHRRGQGYGQQDDRRGHK